MTKKSLDDLKFMIPLWGDNGVEYFNVFNHHGVRRSAAMYLTKKWKMPTEDKEDGLFKTPLEQWAFWMFCDMWSRFEYEVSFGEVGKVGEKMDAFTLYLLPNAALLKRMVDEVSIESAKRFLTEDNKRRRKRNG